MNELFAAWNKAIRKIWRLPYTAHTSVLGPINGQPHISEQLVCRFARFYERLVQRKNDFVNFMKICMHNGRSHMKRNLNFIYFNYNTQLHIDGARHFLNVVNLRFNTCVSDDVKILIDLLSIRDGFKILESFSHQEILDLIVFISTC